MIKTQIHSRRRKPTKSVISASPGQVQGHPVPHDNNSNQSDPGHFTPSTTRDGTTLTGSRNNTEALDMSTAEVKVHDLEDCDNEGHDISAEDQSRKTDELNQN